MNSSTDDTRDLSAPPSQLLMPVDATVEPPVETKQQILPVEKLSWENFERLCLRMARAFGDVRGCHLYGTRGQAQDGIDVYVRRGDQEKMDVYQCKKLSHFTPATLKDAVEKFVCGSWRERSQAFFVFTSFSAVRTELRNEIEDQRKILASKAIAFDVLDVEEISQRLKTQPEIVFDFFGRAWMESFCTKGLGDSRRRLDAIDMVQFRSGMGSFYKSLFGFADPGIPIQPKPGLPSIDLAERYELLDVLTSERTTKVGLYARPGAEVGAPSPDTNGEQEAIRFAEFQGRRNVFDWLSTSDRSLIVGGPGSGKSTLLHYLALDLLSESPRLVDTNARWASKLPVWIPFAYWTGLIAKGDGKVVSLMECVHEWLKSYQQEVVFPIVSAALEDNRLLLLVDGLDEWASEHAGAVAAQLLHVFAEERNISVLVTTRQYGAERLPKFFGSSWQQATLAPLTQKQQSGLARKWFLIKNRLDSSDVAASPYEMDPDTETKRFLSSLNESPEMVRLAQEPLLLVLLLLLWFQGALLPKQRFQAYDEILRHFLELHPARRRQSALAAETRQPLPSSIIREALGYLAYVVQCEHPNQIIDVKDARSTIESYLRDPDLGPGMQKAEALVHVDDFVNISEGSLGIIVRQGYAELSFLHRSFQEQLAAEHIARRAAPEQVKIIEAHARDAQWREVILALLARTPRPSDVGVLVEALTRHVDESPSGIAVFDLLTEVAFGEFHCPSALARRIGNDALTRVERHGLISHRKRLLRHALDGLRSAVLRTAVEHRVEAWTFAHPSRAAVCAALGTWPRDDEVTFALTSALYDEESSVQRSAAHSLVAIGAGDASIFECLAKVGAESPSPTSRAACLEVLCKNDRSSPGTLALVEDARKSASFEIQLVGLISRIRAGERNQSDYAFLTFLMSDDQYQKIDYEWRWLVVDCLVEGWAGDSELLAFCLSSLREHEDARRISRDVALSVLIEGFPGDEQAAEYLSQELRIGRPFLSVMKTEMFGSVARNFRDNPVVVEALDAWLEMSESKIPPDYCLAARAGRTPRMKERLLKGLGEGFVWWPALILLEEWGMEDPEVKDALVAIADSRRASDIIHLIPKMFDAAEAERRIKEIAIGDRYVSRPDTLIDVVCKLPNLKSDPDVVTACIEKVNDAPTALMLDVHALESLILAFPDDPRVGERALAALDDADAPVGAIARKYGNVPRVREAVLRMAHSLPKALRATAVEGVGRLRDDRFALTILSRYHEEQDDEVRSLASTAYHRHLVDSGADSSLAVQRLMQDIRAGGFHMAARRRAALAGLIILRQLPKAFSGDDSDGPPIKMVGIADYFKLNVPLARLIAEEWSYINEACDGEIAEKFSAPGSPPFWEALSPVAADFPQVRAALLQIVRNETAGKISPNKIAFLGKAEPHSGYLRNVCLDVLRTGGSPDYGYGSALQAAAILAEQFANDPETLQLLVSGGVSLHDEATVIALCAGWPQCGEIDRLYDQCLAPNRPPMPYRAFINVSLARVPSEQLTSAYFNLLRTIPQHLYSDLAAGMRSRLRWDTSARESLIEQTRTHGNPNHRHLAANVPGLLRSAHALDEAFAAWCIDALSVERYGDGKEMALEIQSAEVTPVAVCLLNALGAA